MNKTYMNITSIEGYIEDRLSEKRRSHTERVAELAERMALRFGADPVKARTASLLHDIFRGTPIEEINKYVKEFGLPDKYLNNANLAHSKLAAAAIQKDLGITDKEIINAISFHTTGREGMSQLEKVVFLADEIEPGRMFPGVENLRELADSDIDEACYETLKGNIRFLIEKGVEVDDDTLKAERWFATLTSMKGDK